MFHRVKTEPAPGTEKQDHTGEAAKVYPQAQQQPQTQQPQAQAPQQAPQAQAVAKSAQDNQVQPQAKQINTVKEESTPKKEETKTMIDQSPKKPDATPESNAPRALDIPGGNAYQRPGQPPVRAVAPGNFPGSYPGYNAQPNAMSQNERRLIIGRGITMSGEIESCDHLIVEGTVEASLKGAALLDIAESGVFYGTVEIGEATVAGRFEGDLKVNGRLTIRSGGAITGSISYKELEVEAGAIIDGRLSPIGAQSAERKGQPQKNRDAAPAKPRREDAGQNDGQGLFSEKATAAE